MTTQGLPNFPTRRSLDAKIRRYALAAHNRGEHFLKPKPTCPLCGPVTLDGSVSA